MPKLPPLGTTTSQPAKKPKGGFFAQPQVDDLIYRGEPIVRQNPVHDPSIPPIIEMLMGGGAQGTPDPMNYQGGGFGLPPDFRVPGVTGSPELAIPEPKPEYVDTAQVSVIPEEDSIRKRIEEYNRKAAELNLKPLPPALQALVLPASPVRDIKGEGKARAEEASLANWLPLLSLLTTGNVSTGVDLIPGAYSSIAGGSEKFQDKLFTVESENYRDTIQRILNQRAIDESTRNQEVGIVSAENQGRLKIQDDQLAGIKTLIDYDLAQERAKRELEKTYGAQRTAFLRQLQRTPESQQLALWNTVKDYWDEWGIRPLIDETGKYHPIGWNTDIIGYANAKTAQDRLKFMQDSFGTKSKQWEKAHSLNVQKAKDVVTLKKLEISARKEIAQLARDSAWNRMTYRENGINARFEDNMDLKRAVFFSNWKMKMESKGGVKINQLFDRAEGLRLHRRSLDSQIQAIQKDKTKFSKKDRDALLLKYNAELEAITPLINDAEARIASLIDQRDTGYITEDFVDTMIPDSISNSFWDIIDPSGKTAGDSGSKARVQTSRARGQVRVPGTAGFKKPPLPPPSKAVGKPGRPAPRGARPPQGRTSPPRKPLPKDLSNVSTEELLNRAKGR